MSTQTERQFVKVAIEERIALITLDHPPVNALNSQTLAELAALVDELAANDDVGVLIITGAGQHAFVAGADLKEMHENFHSGDASRGEAHLWAGQGVLDKIESLAKPVIAAINGLCLGGGLELAMACHLRISTDRAGFQQPEIDLGLMPGFGGTQRLPRLIGTGRAMELLLTGAKINAPEAQRIGLINKVVPDGTVVREARTLAKKILGKSAQAVRAVLQAVREGGSMTQAEGLKLEGRLFLETSQSDNAREGVQAFLEKRPPNFK